MLGAEGEEGGGGVVVDTEGQWSLLIGYETTVALSATPQYIHSNFVL